MSGFQNAVVIGAGTMGHGIAQVCAQNGIPTTLVDVSGDAAQRGLDHIRQNLDKGVERNKVSAQEREQTLTRLSIATSLDALGAADLMIEAAPEKMALKREIFQTADEKMPPGALLGTNTSSLSITEIAAATKRPQQVIGLHFFNPVHIMKLLEIVRGAHTDDDTLRRALALGAALQKTHVVVNDAPGFATSRLGITLGNEAMRMVEEGVASASDIDTAMTLGYGHPMGPLALTDLVGLDVRLAITTALYEEIGTDTFRPPRILRRLVRAGALGKKAGQGFFLYHEGKKQGENPLTHSTSGPV